MAFTVEDGTGLANANAFISVAFYRTYHTERGRNVPASPTLADATIQTWIIRATDYLVKRFGLKFKGARTTMVQALPFPRTGITVDGVEVDDASLPITLQQATAEYALRASLVPELAPDPPLPFDTVDSEGNTVSGSGPVIAKDEKVGPIEEATTYAGPKDIPTSGKGSETVSGWVIPTYPAADLLIEPLISSSGKVIRN